MKQSVDVLQGLLWIWVLYNYLNIFPQAKFQVLLFIGQRLVGSDGSDEFAQWFPF